MLLILLLLVTAQLIDNWLVNQQYCSSRYTDANMYRYSIYLWVNILYLWINKYFGHYFFGTVSLGLLLWDCFFENWAEVIKLLGHHQLSLPNKSMMAFGLIPIRKMWKRRELQKTASLTSIRLSDPSSHGWPGSEITICDVFI